MLWYNKLLKLFAKLKQLKMLQTLGQECGSILIFTAVGVPILLALAGFGFDVGNLYMHKARLQNVADAAALAGARAYIDNLDTTKGGTVTDGDTPSNPSHANEVAQEYVAKNSINLPNNIYHDFNSLKIRESDDSNTLYPNKAFYRIGLYEHVPLYFLPVIKGIGKTQKVRAEAITVAIKGETTTISGGGNSTPPTVTNPSVFDNLFTYSEYFDTGLANQNNNVNAVYVGNMVYTYGNGSSTKDVYYNIDKMIGGQSQAVEHIFSDDTGASEYLPSMRENPSGTSSSSWAKVNDPIIDTYYNTTSYVSAFENKLNTTHIDVYKTDLFASDINNHAGNLYNQQVKINDKSVQQKGGVLYIKDGSDSVYYAVDPATNAYMYIEESGVQYQVYYVRPQNAGYVCKCVELDGKYYLLNESNTRSNCYVSTTEFNNQKMVIDISGDGKHPLRYENGIWQYGINDGYGNFNTWNNVQQTQLRNNSYPAALINTTFDQNDAKYTAHIDSNVFHFSKSYQANVNNVNISITEALDLDTENPAKPIYLIIDNTIDGSINVTVYDNVRPVILVYLGTGNIKLQNGGDENTVAKLTIYAPYGTVGITPDQEQINYIGVFYGNIIGRRIANQASGGPGGKWIQQNLLENDDYIDTDVAAVTSEIENNIKNATALPDDIKTQVMQRYANALSKNLSDMDDPLFYSKLGYNEKQTLYTTWKALRSEFSEYANKLWPWNEHFNIESGEDQTVTTPDNIRIINPRVEENPFTIYGIKWKML